jgi:hypothetical protein
LLESPEKLLDPEYDEFQVDWASINAAWVKVDSSSGLLHVHIFFISKFRYVDYSFSFFQGVVSFAPREERSLDLNFFPKKCWGSILASMDQDEMEILSDQVISCIYSLC